jgi:nucleotide-binding universal stress UspA family protein
MKVLLAYDGSATAATALRAVASLFPSAQALVATVPPEIAVSAGTAVPVLPHGSPAALQQTIDDLGAEAAEQAHATAQEGVEHARALGLDARVAPVAARAPAWTALLDAAKDADADVIACGTRGRGGFARALLGSTSSSLLHHTDRPLLVVPDGGGALDGPVIAAYDGSEGAKRTIEVVGRLFGGRATVVVHAWESEFHRSLTARALASGPVDDLREMVKLFQEAFEEDAAATTEAGVAVARAAGLDAAGDKIEAMDGAWRTIAAAARSHGAAVIAVGSRGLGGARSALLGSVSSGLVHNAELPVLIVPAQP